MNEEPGAEVTPPSPMRDERGDTTITAVIVVPAILALVWLVFQVVVFMLGRNVVLDAARHGASAGRVAPFDTAVAQSTATDYASRSTVGWLTGVQASAVIVENRMQVTVTAESAQLVPFVDLVVSQTASVPLERVTP